MKINEGFDWSFREWTVKSIEEVIRNEFSHLEGYATADNIIYLPVFSFTSLSGATFNALNKIGIRFSKSGYAFMRFDFNRNYQNDLFYVNAACTALTNDFPLYVLPICTIKIGNNIIDTSILNTYGTVPAPFKFKKETLTFRDRGGYTFTRDFMILYCDITNIPVVRIGQFDFYDFRSYPVVEYPLNGIRQKFIIDREIQYEISSKMLYPYDAYASTDEFQVDQSTMRLFYKFNEFSEGETVMKGKILYSRESNPTSSHDYYIPKMWKESIGVKGNSPILIDDNQYRGACFLFGINNTSLSCDLKRYNKINDNEDYYGGDMGYVIPSTPTGTDPYTQPSHWWYMSGNTDYYYPATGQIFPTFPLIACPLFSIDMNVNTQYRGFNILGYGNGTPHLGSGFISNGGASIVNSFDEETVPDPNWINTH